MCGIVAYIGKEEAKPFIIEGLKKLEYRGYDSVGIAVLNDEIHHYKKKGRIKDLEEFIADKELHGTVGIGHTRWATHGEPSDLNAHPHLSQSGDIAIVHNGIIENYSVLKKLLEELGHEFKSDTDTEVMVHLIEAYLQRDNIPIDSAIRKAMRRVEGAYAIVVLDKNNPDMLYAAKKGSSLIVGLSDNGFLISSDASPIVGHTNKVIYLNEEEVIAMEKNGSYTITNIQNVRKKADIKEIDLKIEELEKGGYEHFMLKEIHQQPETIKDCLRGRMNANEGWIKLGGVEEFDNFISNAQRFIIAACGTSWHAGLVAEYLFEDLARIPVEVEYASELRYRNPIITENDVVIALSQSGETADTLSALRLAKEKGAFIYGIVNVVGSTIARITDAGSYIHAGPEIGIASTKAFTGQLALLTMMALSLGRKRGTIPTTKYYNLLHELENIPNKIKEILEKSSHIEYIAKEIASANNALYLGRGYNFPIALEGALKLKEISYVHAEGYPAAEVKHGPLALIDENMPVIFIATNEAAYDKIINNLQEVKARKGRTIAIVAEGDSEIKYIADYCIEIPKTEDALSPLLSVIPLQLLSYYIAVERGCDVDQPRNLVKSVTVE